MDDDIELESQMILRLPIETARILRALINAGVSLRDRLSLEIYNDLRHVVFQMDNWIYYGKIYDLPTMVESLKTVDSKSFFKTADISQICVCKNEEFSSPEDNLSTLNKADCITNKKVKYLWPHGLTPPLKNVRKHRFRKTLPKEFVELSEVEREVKTLLRADNDAVSVKWEIIYEDDNRKNSRNCKKEVEESDIFGEQVSDDDFAKSSELFSKYDERRNELVDEGGYDENSENDSNRAGALLPKTIDYEEFGRLLKNEIASLEDGKFN